MFGTSPLLPPTAIPLRRRESTNAPAAIVAPTTDRSRLAAGEIDTLASAPPPDLDTIAGRLGAGGPPVPTILASM